ncbi:MAG: hypothetical protein LBQ33_00030, partial [Oscillospiraceae bacterium]|nr:hypothetical protein [Oscillospiraceae bacterium]
MKAIFSAIMAFLISIFSWIPGLWGGTDASGEAAKAPGITVGEWLDVLVDSFNMEASPYSSTPYYASVPADDPYFAQVQIAYAWGVVTATDQFKTSDKLEISFQAATLVRIAGLTLDYDVSALDLSLFAGAANAEELAIALENGFISLSGGKFKDGIADKADALAAATKAVEQWVNKNYDQEALDVTLRESGFSLGAQADFGGDSGEIGIENPDKDATDVFEAVEFQGSFAPDLRASSITDAAGNVLNEGVAGDPNSVPTQVIAGQGFSLEDLKNFDVKDALSKIEWKELLKKINFSFNIGELSVGVAVLGEGFRVELSGPVYDGISLTKKYELTNFDLDAQMDADILKAKIRHAYINLGYDLTE